MSNGTRNRPTLWSVSAFLSIGVGLYAIAFLAVPSLSAEFLDGHGNDYTLGGFLLAHVAFAAPAMILGPFQFIASLRGSYPTLHRTIGYIYVICVLASAIASFIAAQQALTGFTAHLGFSLLAVAWAYTTIQAVVSARANRLGMHQLWMKRSFALTFAAVTLRIQLGLVMGMELSFDTYYPAIAWACWVPNLLFVDWFWHSQSVTPKDRLAHA